MVHHQSMLCIYWNILKIFLFKSYVEEWYIALHWIGWILDFCKSDVLCVCLICIGLYIVCQIHLPCVIYSDCNNNIIHYEKYDVADSTYLSVIDTCEKFMLIHMTTKALWLIMLCVVVSRSTIICHLYWWLEISFVSRYVRKLWWALI